MNAPPPYGGPPGGGYGGPPGGGGYGAPPGGGGYGGPPGGGGYGGPPPPPPGGFGGPPGGGYGAPPAGPPGGYQPPMPGGPGPGGQTLEPTAIVSLIAGIFGLPSSFCCSFLAIPVWIIAIASGGWAISQINREPHRLKGKELAYIGIGLGAFGFILFGIFLALGLGSALLGKL